MENLKKKLWEELDEIDRKDEIGPGDLELAHKLTDTIKNIDKICMLEGEDGSGYSSANRGKHYVRGHYSRDGGRDGMRDGYSSRRDGRGRYSRDDGRSEMMEHLEMALDSATEQDREMIRRFIKDLEKA
ncbi:MAG: hypothetical protein HFJ42_10110 [Clostridia bacterium]|nr:hypothetical protein [Clostridia bacterium]